MEKVEFQLLGRVGHGNSKNYSITLDNIPSKDPAASLARAITTFIQDLLNGINNCGLPETQEETFQRIS
ncbi:MAG: hypothetical protein H6767_04695 [Candidatus Peribacteria bacterium]|nr:MAG: hypothetical protein H6767_04695 [Candidatus Peribacteria bacterium]